jgi:hypothetical protein
MRDSYSTKNACEFTTKVLKESHEEENDCWDFRFFYLATPSSVAYMLVY